MATCAIYERIVCATILRRPGHADKVYLRTTLPEATYPFKGVLDFQFDVAAGQAERYLQDHLRDLPYTIVEG